MTKDKIATLQNELRAIRDSAIEVENITYIPADNEVSKKSIIKNLQCSIMFVDMRNSTQMQDINGRKNMVKIYKMFARLVIKAVEENGGKVMQIVGDGFLCLFVNDEINSGQKAINAAISINTYVSKAYNEIVNDKWTIGFGCGICSGHVYITKIGVKGKNKCSQLAFPSSVTNYASKFCGLADKGCVIVDYETFKQLNKDSKKYLNEIKTVNYGSAFCMENVTWKIC